MKAAYRAGGSRIENNRLVQVCDACLQASCLAGEFMCEAAVSAGVTTRTVGELRTMAREHPDYWKDEA